MAIVFWPHPLIHWLNRALNRAREEVCDNFVLQHREAVGYAETLLLVAEEYGPSRTAAVLAFLAPRWPLERRVADLLDTRRNKGTAMTKKNLLATAATALALTVTLAGVRFSPADEPAEQTVAKPQPANSGEDVAAPGEPNPDQTQATQAIRSAGGKFDVADDGTIRAVHLNNSKATNETLAALTSLENLRRLYLARTSIDDVGLKHLRNHKNRGYLVLTFRMKACANWPG